MSQVGLNITRKSKVIKDLLEYGFVALDGFLREDLRRRVEHSDEHTEDGEDAADDGARALRIASRQRALSACTS